MLTPDTNQTEDLKRFEVFIGEHRAVLVGFLRKKLGSLEDAEDVAQDSAARLIQYAANPPEVLKCILYRIALNAAIDLVRRRHGKVDTLIDDFEILMEASPSTDRIPEEVVQSSQEIALAKRAILQLPGHCKNIYLLNRVDGMTYRQISERYNISIKAVEKQMSKALALINKYMDDHGAGRGER